MKKKWLGYTAWLLAAACLYFFENNTGTRIVLACSLALWLIPALRAAFFAPDAYPGAEEARAVTAQAFAQREADDTADVRPYVPGDPIRRIHWKLSARKGELLVRESAHEWEAAEEEKRTPSKAAPGNNAKLAKLSWLLTAGLLLSLLLLLTPVAGNGVRALCNRLFAASEAVNAYSYDYFPIADEHGAGLAAFLLSLAGALLAALIFCQRSRALTLAAAAALTLGQCYFGLSLPAWLNVSAYSLIALRLMRRPLSRRDALIFGAFVIAASLLTALTLPGVHEPTEALSETARDYLSRMAQHIAGSHMEASEGEAETRHVFTQSLKSGDRAAATEREFRLVTVEEEQISMPHWVNYLKIILLLLCCGALLILPFAPFALLNARKKKAEEARKAFQSPDVDEAVCAVFASVILWLEYTGCGAGNLLYRQWTDALSRELSEDYAALFSNCAMDFETAVYSGRALPEAARQRALELLANTEAVLYRKADWKQRFLLKYWVCLCE